MSKIEDFLRDEKDHYGKIFVNISYAIDNISPFLEGKDLNRRKYVSNLPILKKYIDLLSATEVEIKKGGIMNIFNNAKYLDLLNGYKRDHSESFNQLEKCNTCACLNCTSSCKFDSCLGCKSGSRIVECDHHKINVTLHDNFMLNLINNNTGQSEQYTVLATLQDAEKNQKYIIIEGLYSKEKFILYYYPGISEDSYGEITDPEEFDFIVETYNSIQK